VDRAAPTAGKTPMAEPRNRPLARVLGYLKGSRKARQETPARPIREESNVGTGELTMTKACAMPNMPTATGTSGMPLSKAGMPSV